MTTTPDNPNSPAQAPMSEDALAERIAEIEARIQHGMAGDAMVLMREHVPWLLEQLRTAQAEITTLRARDIAALRAARNEALEEALATVKQLMKHLWTKQAVLLWAELEPAIRGLKDRPQTCFECGADLAALAPICPKCNPNYQSAARLASDLATAERLLRRAVTELRGWCAYDDAETRGFLEREKPE